MLTIGSAQADITPELPMIMGGSFLKFPSEKLLDPIMASCLVADDGKARLAVVSCDLASVPNRLTETVRERVSRETGTPPERIHLMATHNHSGPTVHPLEDQPFGDNDPTASQARDTMLEKLATRIADCVVAAHARLVPAGMGYGRGTVEGCAFNRRFIMSNGRSRMHGAGPKELIRLKAEGPVDPELQVVWFEAEEGRPLAIMVNYSSHATNFYAMPIVSADFPGVMRCILQSVFGADVPVLYLQGACGNVMCSSLDQPVFAGRGEARARRIGQSLAGEVLKVMNTNALRKDGIGIAFARRLLDMPYREVPPIPFDEAAERWRHYREQWDTFTSLDIEDRAVINSTLRLARYLEKAPSDRLEIAAFSMGEVLFLTNPAEYFVEYQLEIKRRVSHRPVILSELTNGRAGYVPTRLACALGGYEAIQTRFNPDAGEKILEASVELLAGLTRSPAAGAVI